MVRWARVEGFPDYEVSTEGKVRSWRMSRCYGYLKKDKIVPRLMSCRENRGYVMVTLCADGNRMKAFAVHRLVAQAFIPNPDNKPMVAHNNGIRHDNRVENLRWATGSENASDRIIHGTARRGSTHPRAKLLESDVGHIRERLKKRERGDVLAIATEFGVDTKTLRSALYGKTWKHITTEPAVSKRYSTRAKSKVYAALHEHGGWATVKEITKLARVARRTANEYLLRFVSAGVALRTEGFPSRYQLTTNARPN